MIFKLTIKDVDFKLVNNYNHNFKIVAGDMASMVKLKELDGVKIKDLDVIMLKDLYVKRGAGVL